MTRTYGRMTDADRRWGPLTWGPCGYSWRPLSAYVESGDDGYPGSAFVAYALGWCMRLALPDWLGPRPAVEWRSDRVGGRWQDISRRRFGFSLCDGFLQVFMGRQTDNSTTEQQWSCHLPWTQWRHVRHSYYGLGGEHLLDEPEVIPGLGDDRIAQFRRMEAFREAMPKAVFVVEDFDGALVVATTFVEEREWRFGTGWFRWLSVFRRPKIVRSLNITFGSEVGRDKGSWKGGTIGHGIEMLPTESHEGAMRRYCDQEHRAKHGAYRLRFVRRAP